MKAISSRTGLACWLLVSLGACSGKLDRQAYGHWIRDRDHGLHVTKPVGELVWDVQYMPTDYVWLQRADSQESQPDESTKQAIANLQYYTVTLSVNDPAVDLMAYQRTDPQDKQRQFYYFSYQFQEDIALEEQGQRLPCVLFHFEKYAVSARNSRTFVLGFENPHPVSAEAKLIIDCKQFSTLPVHIKVSKNNIPALQL